MQKIAKNLKAGEIIIFQERLMKVEQTPKLVQPGKGGAFAQVILRDIKNNTSRHERFKTDDMLEKAYIDKVPVQFLFFDGNNYVFLNNQTFEQYEMSQNLISDEEKQFLFNDIKLHINLYNEEIISIELPIKISLQVIEKETALKHAQQNPSYKKAILENNIETKIPVYINAGEYVIIKTEDCSFVNRDNTK